MENEGNNENNGDKARVSIETDSAAKGEEDSFVTCEEGNENSGNASEEDVNDVEEEEEEEEAPPINQVFRSCKRKSRKTHVESDSDESKDDELASATMAEGKGELGSQTRERKRSKYLSYPYYTDGFLKLIAKDSKIPKQLRESITEEDSKIAKVSAGRKSNKKPCKNPVDSSDDSEAINMRCREALSQLKMAAIDYYCPTLKNSFDSMKVFFSMFRNSAFHDESNTGLSSENTIQQRDVLESSVADRKPRSYDLSSPKVLALYSPRYLALYPPKTFARSRKARKATRLSRKDTIDKMDVDSSVADKTSSPGLSSPVDKAGPKRRNRKQKVPEDTPEPKRTNRTKRLKLMSLNDISTDGAVIAKLHNLEHIPLMIDWPIDPEPKKDEKNSDASVSMNTDLCTDIQDADGNTWEDENKKLASDEKPVRKRRARKEKTGIDHQASCATDVQNLNENVVEPIIQGTGASKAKRGRKKKVTTQNSVINQQNGTSDGTNMIGNEAEPVLLLGHEAEPVLLLGHEAKLNEVESIIQGTDASKAKRGRKKKVTTQNSVINQQNGTSDGTNMIGNEAEPVLLLGHEAEPVLLLGHEAKLNEVTSKAKRGRKKKVTTQNSVINQQNSTSDGTNMIGNEAEPVLLLGHEAEPVLLLGHEAEPVLLLGHEAKLNEVEPIIQRTDASKAKRGRKKKVTTQNSVINQHNSTSDGTNMIGNEAEPVLLLGHEAKLNEVEPIIQGTYASKAKRGRKKKVTKQNSVINTSDGTNMIGNEAEPVLLLGHEAEPVLLLGHEAKLNEVEPIIQGTDASKAKRGRKKKVTTQNSVINQQNSTFDGTNMIGNEAEPVLLLGHEAKLNEVEPIIQGTYASKAKRGRKKKVTTQNSVINQQNSTFDGTNMIGNEAEPVLLLGHEAKLNEVEPIIQGTYASKAKRGRKKKVTTQNSVKTQQNSTSDGTNMIGNEAEPVLLLGHEAEPVLLLGHEAKLNEVEPIIQRTDASKVKRGRKKKVTTQNSVINQQHNSSDGTNMNENEAEPILLLGHEAEPVLLLGHEAKPISLENEVEPIMLGNVFPEAKPVTTKKSYPVGGMPPLSVVKQNLETMTVMLAKTSVKVPAEMKSKLKDKIERLIVKVNAREGSSSSLT